MDGLVWVDGWQLECCGDPFAVGDVVTWDCTDADDEWLASTLGPQAARTIRFAEQHHDEPAADHPVVRGTVVGIQAAFCRYAPGPDPTLLQPVPGSGVLRAIRSTGTGDEDPSGAHFLGYVVTLGPADWPAGTPRAAGAARGS